MNLFRYTKPLRPDPEEIMEDAEIIIQRAEEAQTTKTTPSECMREIDSLAP